MIYSHTPSENIGQISYPDYEYYRDHNHVFEDVAAAPNSISVNEDRNFEHQDVKVMSRPVSGNYLTVMGIHPFLGRLLSPEDERSKVKVAVMTYSCWSRLGANPNVVGKTLSGMTIVGVLPRQFTGSLYGVNGDLLIPLSESASSTNRDDRQLILIARLKPGAGRQQAQAEIAAMSGQLATAYPKEDKDRSAVLTRATMISPDGIPTAEWMIGILIAVVLLVLLIACANVANLLLAIAVGRRQEAAIKLAIGASRGRLIRDFLSETAILCVASSVLGYFLAAFVVARFATVNIVLPIVGAFSFGMNLRLDATVIGFTLALMLIAILATGLAPALYASAPSLASVLSGELMVGGTRKAARRNLLVIIQVAVCTVVLVGMGLCQRNLYNLRRVDPGFSARKLVAIMVYPSDEHPVEARVKMLEQSLRRQVSAMPGIEAVSLATGLPFLAGGKDPVEFPDGSKQVQAGHSIVDEDYFDTFGIRLLAGRVFRPTDGEGSPQVVIVNQNMAKLFWPGEEAVGKSLMLGTPPQRAGVIGVVADGKYENLDEPSGPYLYYALGQHFQNSINMVVRTKGDPRQWIQPLKRVVNDADMVALSPVTFDEWMNFALITQRIAAGCVAALSALGLLLAVIGLFGAISYSVSERRKELGIRVALGARPWQLLKMVLRQTLLIAGAGIVIGVLLGVAAAMLLRSRFYEVGVVEWTVLLPVSFAMLSISLVVAYFSARAWLSISPMEAVRHA
jgi:predicted permease